MSQAVRRLSFNMKARSASREGPRGFFFYGGQADTGTGFSSNSSTLRSQCRYPNSPYSFIPFTTKAINFAAGSVFK